jgi:hypothetical protein
MQSGDRVRPIPMRARRNDGAASLWNEAEWKKMRGAGAKIPATLQEALLMGYALDADQEESRSSGGLLGEEFVEGSFVLRKEWVDGPDLVLPYRARLEFGQPRVKKEPQQQGESK